jgi:hypothetical protein
MGMRNWTGRLAFIQTMILSIESWRLRGTGSSAAQDTFYVGTLKGVGRIYQQTAIDTYSKVAFAKLYDRKTPLTSADLLNDRVVPFFDTHDLAVSRVLTDRGTEYCGRPESHDYELYLAIENIDHTRTKVKSLARPTAFASASTKPCWMSFTVSPSAKGFMTASMRYKGIWMPGWWPITKTGPIKADGASARRRCKPSSMQNPWRGRK